MDGKESFYGPQSVSFRDAAVTKLQSYPNPFSSEINLVLPSAGAGPVTVTILNGMGCQLRTLQLALGAGATSLRLGDLASLSNGIYVVQVQYNDGRTQQSKIVKE